MQTSNRLCDGQYIGLVYFTTVAMKLQQKRFRLMMTNPNVAYCNSQRNLQFVQLQALKMISTNTIAYNKKNHVEMKVGAFKLFL